MIPESKNMAPDAPSSPGQLLAKATRFYTEAADYAQRDRPELDLKLRFFRSIQHRIRRRRRNVDYGFDVENPDDRVAFETVPLLRATIRQAVALFLADLPRLSVVPRGSGVVARKQAQLAERLVNGMTTCYPELFESLYEAKLLAEITGGAWHKTFWDAESFEDGASPEGVPLGAVAWEALSRLDVFRDPRAQRPRKVRYLAHRKCMPREQAAEVYKTDYIGNPIKPEDFTVLGARHPNPLSQQQSDHLGPTKNSDNELVEIIEFWIQRSRNFPHGGLIVFSGGKILAMPMVEAAPGAGTMIQIPEMEAPLTLAMPDDYWPWVYIRGLNKVPGKFDPDGLAQDLIPLQVTINHMMSRIREGVNLSSQNYLTASRDANIDVDNLDNIDGTVVLHDGQLPPQFIQGPGPHQGTMAALADAKESYNTVSTQLEAGRGITNGQANAKLLAVSQELGRTIHSPDIAMSMNGEIAPIFKNNLACMSANYTPDRFVRMLGPNDQPLTQLFDPAIFHPGITLVFIPGQAPPPSRELFESKIMEAATAGLFEDTPAAQRARDKIRWMKDGDDALDPKSAHTERVEMEQVLFITQGIPPTLLQADDDAIHLQHDEAFLVSAEFLSMPPELQQVYQEHVQGHQIQLATKEGMYSASAAALGGKAGPSAPPPGGAGPAGPADGRGAETPFDGGAKNTPDASSADVPSAGNMARPA